MADTTSIASRMEKLAKLKRMKEELASEPAPAPMESAAKIVTPTSDTPEAFEDSAPAAPSFSDESDAPVAEDFSQSPEFLDTDPEIDDSADFDPTSEWENEYSEQSAAEADAQLDEAQPVAAENRDVDFTMEDVAEAQDQNDDLTDLDVAAEADALENDLDDDLLANEIEDKPTAKRPAPAFDLDEETMSDFDEISALAGAGGIAAVAATATAATAASADPIEDELVDTAEEVVQPDFSTKEIEAELLEREFAEEAAAEEVASEEPEVAETSAPAETDDETDGRISVSFDASRSTLLDHVSRQMGCSVDDVVVTALDWYLDALFGEDQEEAKSA